MIRRDSAYPHYPKERGREPQAAGRRCEDVSTVASFDPASLAGLQQWGSALSLSLNDGDPVQTVPDLSGAGRDATQATPGNRPTYRANTGNGKRGIQFASASTTRLVTPQTIPVTSFTMFCVARQNAAPPANQTLYMIGDTTPGGTGELCFARLNNCGTFGGTSETIQTRKLPCPGSPTAFALIDQKWDGIARWPVSSPYIVTRHEFTPSCFDAGSSALHKLYKNGVLVVMANSQAPADPFFFGPVLWTKQISIGCGAAAGGGSPINPFDGYIAEWLIYSPALSNVNAASVEAFLTSRLL